MGQNDKVRANIFNHEHEHGSLRGERGKKDKKFRGMALLDPLSPLSKNNFIKNGIFVSGFAGGGMKWIPPDTKI